MGGLGGGFGGGGENSILGNFLSTSGPLSYEKGKTKVTTKSKADELTRELNQLKSDEIKGALRATGGYEQLLGEETDRAYSLGQGAKDLLNRYIQSTQQRGFTPEDFLGLANYATDPTAGYAATDPTQSLALAQDYFNQIALPGLQNQYAASGLGRSGALGESAARAGTQLAQPILQQQLQNRFALTQQQLQNRFAAVQQFPNVDVTLRNAELSRLYGGFQAADYERALQQQRLGQRLGGLQGALSLAPYVAGQEGRSTTREYGNILSDIVLPILASALGGGAGGLGGGTVQSTSPGAVAPQGTTSGGTAYGAPLQYGQAPAVPGYGGSTFGGGNLTYQNRGF